MYPTTLITPISSVSIAKNNITMSDHDELSIIISRQTQSLLTPSTSQSTLTSIPQQLSKAVDIALSCSLTRIQSQTTFILPHSPFCASVCGTLRPYYPYQFINSNGAHITPSEDNVIQIFSTTPQTKVSITLGKREEEGMIKRGEKIQKSQIKLDKNNTTDQDPCPIEPLSFPATPTHPNPQNPQNSLVDKSSSIPIAGLDQEMRILKETLELPLKQPELFSTFGLKPPKGVLLHGPPGCGKTLLAHWFSNYTSAQFIPLTATNIISRGGANYLYSLFNSLSSSSSSTAPSQSNSGSIPIILFIDEIDGLCSDNTVVCALLSLLDGGHDRFSNICILAATNRPNVLPPALRRPGRFDVELNITPPSIQARDDILRVKLEKKNILHELTRTEISSIADHANGFVGADIDLLISEAISHSVLTMYRKQEERNESKKFIEIDSSITQTSKLTLADFSYALQVVRPSGLRDYSSISITDSQVGGHEEIKQRLEEAFEWPLRHANLVDMLGARKSSGILLFGPPGCAKTLLAKSICARSKRTFLSVKGPELFSKYVGDSEKAVRAVFQRARACAPCILFLDEVDSFGGARGGSGGGGGGDATDRVVSQLLVELDGISDRGDVCILAATNRPDMVDRALLRAGRLDRSLYVGPPDLNETEQILNINFKQMSCEDDVFLQMKQVAKMCFEKRHTGAELAAICRDASVRALTRYITQQEVKMKVMESNLGNLDQEQFAKLLAEFESDGEENDENDENDENKPLTKKSADEKDVYVTLADVFGAVDEAVPRITPNMIQFYLDYQLKHGLTNL
jgi:SpoVK/Ycf46/Vps4 family AAA+-type ATPase